VKTLKKRLGTLKEGIKALTWKDSAKYFAHGLAFSILFFVLGILWLFILTNLVSVSTFLEFFAGLIGLFLFVGFLNTFLTKQLWFEVKYRFWDSLFQGGILFFTLLLTNLILISLPTLIFPDIVTIIITFVIATFANGLICKAVASWWMHDYGLRIQRMSNRTITLGIAKNILAIILELAILFPVMWVFSLSIRTTDSLLTTTLQIIPPKPTLEPWTYAIFNPASGLWSGLINSLLVSLFASGVCIAIAIPASYSLSRFRFLGKRPLLYLLIFVQFVPGLLMFIAFFYLLLYLHIGLNLFGLGLIYISLVLPFNIWNMKAFFDTLPKDIDEAALIDGASYLRAMFYVVLPLASPGVAVTVFFSFLTAWNEFALANIILVDESSYTLPLRFYGLLQTRAIAENWPHFAAMSVIASVPLVIVFFIVQRYLRTGLAIGAVKG
jgi:arabinogalactan oligomer/maltooligosaccharide transport system permease protein